MQLSGVNEGPWLCFYVFIAFLENFSPLHKSMGQRVDLLHGCCAKSNYARTRLLMLG